MSLKNIILAAIGIFVLYAATLQVRLSATKADLKQAKMTIKTDKAIKDSLNTVVVKLKAQAVTDSTNHAEMLKSLQTVVQSFRNENKAVIKENTELKAGLFRYRVNVFGKEKLERIP